MSTTEIPSPNDQTREPAANGQTAEVGTATPVLSIGLPVYNGAVYLREALDSILKQNCDLELIISDNASTDDTEAICRQYADADPRIRYYRYEENRGAAWNYNNCFELARGDFFKWAAHDDRIEPDFCEKCLAGFEQHPEAVLVYPRVLVIDEGGSVVRKDSDAMDLRDEAPHQRFQRYMDEYRTHGMCNPVFGIFRKSVLGRTALIGNFLASDQILLGETSIHGKIVEIPDHLFHYRWHDNNSTWGLSETERLIWFDPKNSGKLYLYYWKWFNAYRGSLGRAKLSLMERFRCSLILMNWCWRYRRGLCRELVKCTLWPFLKRTKWYRNRQMGI